MKKKIITVLFTVAAIIACFGFSACGLFGGNNGDGDNGSGGGSKPEFAAGTGTETDPYKISQGYQWLNVGKHPDSFFELTADINLGDYKTVAPTGTAESPFEGTIDGNNHKITGAKISSDHNAGLFGVLSGATVKNLGFTSSGVHMESKSDKDVMGSFAAIARKGTIIENCFSQSVSLNFTKYSTKYVMIGGFVGSVESVSAVSYCHSDVNIKAPDGSRFYIGGFARLVSGSMIDCCYTEGTISVWGPSGKNVCRIGTFVDRVINSDVTNMYAEMSVNAKGATGVYYFAGNVDEETLEFCLNFCDYQQAVDGRYEVCGVEYNGSQYVNIYFPSSEYAYANDTLDKSLWCDNPVWKKGRVRPEFVSYEEYLQIKSAGN